jgi:hypothetical protein
VSRRGSRILDRGSELIVLYPEVMRTDRLGNAQLGPDRENPTLRKINVTTDRQSSAELPGQVDVKVLKFSTRTLPVASYALAVFRGEEWDVAIPPIESNISRTTKHVGVILRSRNRGA